MSGLFGSERGYLSLATRFAVHRLAWFDGRATRGETVDTDLRTRHRHIDLDRHEAERVKSRDD